MLGFKSTILVLRDKSSKIVKNFRIALSAQYFLYAVSGGASLSSVVSEDQLSAKFRLPYQLYLGKGTYLQTFQANCQCEQSAPCFYLVV